MANEKRHNIWIQLADVNQPIALSVTPSDEVASREAEKLVNTLWDTWMKRYGEKSSSHELLARVAFQFARLYWVAYQQSNEVNDYLADFERQLDELVVNVE
ncbi:MAG: cell division protein ZapA [Muribaculaceae bacterium]|nr:cell division protein ZapA [Muribaculaceae bacterium]